MKHSSNGYMINKYKSESVTPLYVFVLSPFIEVVTGTVTPSEQHYLFDTGGEK